MSQIDNRVGIAYNELESDICAEYLEKYAKGVEDAGVVIWRSMCYAGEPDHIFNKYFLLCKEP